MVTKLLVVWILAVVAFFVLWAVLAKIVRRISERKRKDDPSFEETDDNTTSQKQ